jgi:uncharacterized membrane protein
MPAQLLVTLVGPLVAVALAIPMILGKVPRNCLYGFRTPYTMSSDPVWYRANRIAGIALAVSGVFWVLMGLILPRVMDSEQAAIRLTGLLGAAGILVGLLVSAWLVYSRK